MRSATNPGGRAPGASPFVALPLLWLACAPAPAAPPEPAGSAAVPVVAAAPEPPPEPPVATRIELIPRSAWGARPVKGALKPHQLSRLTVHHSAQLAPDVKGAPARIRGFQAFHQSKGFPDIAYHYVVDRAGNIYEGRDSGTAGSTFTNYNPAGHFLALLDGNFEVQDPTPEQLRALAELLAWASTRHGISPDTISGHRDHAATACPGKRLYTKVSDGSLKRAVGEVLARGRVELVKLGDAEGAERVKAIASGGRPAGAPAAAKPVDPAPAPAPAPAQPSPP